MDNSSTCLPAPPPPQLLETIDPRPILKSQGTDDATESDLTRVSGSSMSRHPAQQGRWSDALRLFKTKTCSGKSN